MGALLAEGALTMAEIRTVTTLEAKAVEIKRVIGQYERYLAQAKADLAAVNATIALFTNDGKTDNILPYERIQKLMGRGETLPIVLAALRAKGPLTTRQLAVAVMEAKGLDMGDTVLLKVITTRLINILKPDLRKGRIGDGGKHRGMRIWTTPRAAHD